MRRIAFAVVWIYRVVAELVVLDQVPDDVDAKAVDPAPQPKAHHVEHCGTHLRIAPVEVRLRAQERVVVILGGALVVLPRAAAEIGAPIVWWSTVGRGI